MLPAHVPILLQILPSLVPGMTSISEVEVPEPRDLDEYVRNRRAAIALGKALFWDMQLGSDGIVACATCHFHAGADPRVKNQIKAIGGTYFHGNPNHTLSASDYPFHELSDPDDTFSTVLRDTPNRTVSQGVTLHEFVDIVPGSAEDIGEVVFDPDFNVGGVNVRRGAATNAPTAFDSVFNFRQLTVAASQDIFNGVNQWGERTPDVRVFENVRGALSPVAVAIDRASLASQAMDPPVSFFEMSYRGRTFPKIGKKMLSLVPLAKQEIARDDSVLGRMVRPSGTGLKRSYEALIKQAFHRRWWNSRDIVTFPGGTPVIGPRPNRPLTTDEFTQIEANFSLFFGLAVQLYQSTLVSEETTFDRALRGEVELTWEQEQGMRIFYGAPDAFGRTANCATCHSGPELTTQSVANAEHNRVERIPMLFGPMSLIDVGTRNIGVRRSTDAPAMATVVPGVGPLSFARWAQLGNDIHFELQPPIDPNERSSAVLGAYKVVGLRNVELTGPYFHNGGIGTLRQVVDFFNRGTDFPVDDADNIDPIVTTPLGLNQTEKCWLVEFLRALTDPRVRLQQAPFDHPQLFVPDGHEGDSTFVVDDGHGRGVDIIREISAVGRNGGPPLSTFLDLDPHDPGDGSSGGAIGHGYGPRMCVQ
jgi:cytochrome c peroxidase